MMLSPKALSITLALLWGAGMFFVGLLNVFRPPYGADFLVVMGSLYPGIYGAGTVQEALLGLLYGAVDGALGGLVIAWIYNWAAKQG